MGILGLKLRTNTPCADVIKILKQFDPDASISNLRFKIIHNDFVYVCDYIDEDGIITLLNLLHEVEAIKNHENSSNRLGAYARRWPEHCWEVDDDG